MHCRQKTKHEILTSETIRQLLPPCLAEPSCRNPLGKPSYSKSLHSSSQQLDETTESNHLPEHNVSAFITLKPPSTLNHGPLFLVDLRLSDSACDEIIQQPSAKSYGLEEKIPYTLHSNPKALHGLATYIIANSTNGLPDSAPARFGTLCIR